LSRWQPRLRWAELCCALVCLCCTTRARGTGGSTVTVDRRARRVGLRSAVLVTSEPVTKVQQVGEAVWGAQKARPEVALGLRVVCTQRLLDPPRPGGPFFRRKDHGAGRPTGWALKWYTGRHQEPICSGCTVREHQSQPLLLRTGQSQPTRVAAGIDQHDGRRPRDSTVQYPVASRLLLPPPPRRPPRARLVLTSHLPPATSHLQPRLSGCLDPAASAYDLPCRCLG
jgi:hypothetical protein